MYEFKPVTQRILGIRDRIRNRVVLADTERASLVTEFYKNNKHMAPILMRASALHYICEHKTVRVDEGELIVGNLATTFCGAAFYPEWGDTSRWVSEGVKSGEWKIKEDGLYHTPDDYEIDVCVSPEDVKIFDEIKAYWIPERLVCAAEKAWQPECFSELYGMDVTNYRKNGVEIGSMPYGHIIPGYDNIIGIGYAGYKKQLAKWIDENKNRLMGDDTEKYLLYKAAYIAADAGEILCIKYAKACLEAAENEDDAERRNELLTMADGLKNIAVGPARTYLEACQAIMIYVILCKTEENQPGLCFGRFDQYTWPYLKKDLEEGRLTMEKAQEITDAFFLKGNCNWIPGFKEVIVSSGVGNTHHHTTIGGVDRDGNDASNPVTYMVLETIARLKLHDPTVSLRINKNTPEKLWELAITTSTMVGGLPLFINDEAMIPSLINTADMAIEDARNYGLVGCQEAVVCGADYAACGGTHPNHSGVHAGVILNIALNDGKNPMNGYQCALHTGFLYDMRSIEEVHEAFKKIFVYAHDMFISIQNYSDYLAAYNCPYPVLSLTMDDCLSRGKDLSRGGARYNRNGGAVTGFATIADSFTAIKYLCFDKKICTTGELYEAIMADWKGYDDLHMIVENQVPRFGNGDPYADEELKWCAEMYYEVCKNTYSMRAPVYSGGMIGASDHIVQGYRTFATPDGRKSKDALADAASPGQGRDKNGPTGVFKSLLSYEQRVFPQNIALNMRIHPSSLQGGDGWKKLSDLTKTYFAGGGMEVQYNIVDSKVLRAAQENPDEYKDLVVRIAGFSAYFIELDKALQEDIISRNEIEC